uniref:Trematode PH-like domain-containing protein n=1 Tax=Schistosoma haematobium TaxID=6185 RepID=A0A094ZMV0_SCHHA
MTSSSSPMHNNCNSSFNGSGSINGTLCRTGSLGFIDEVLRYSGTKQYIFLQVHVCAIHQVSLGDISDFHETDALSYIDRYYKKRRAHCTAALLEDRICLRRVKQSGKMPFHPWVVYNEIKYIFISRKRPEYFVLCIDSNHDRRKYYEIYKCKSADDVKQIEEKMKAAMRDPDKLLRKMHILSRISLPPKNNENQKELVPKIMVEDKDKKSTSSLSPVTPVKDLTLESLNENYVVSSISITPIEFFHHSPESLIYQIKQSVYEPSQNTHSLPHSMSSESGDIHLETRINDIIDKITFINHDPLKGFCESQNGNFYMFLDRQEFHLNKYIDREESFIISNQKE